MYFSETRKSGTEEAIKLATVTSCESEAHDTSEGFQSKHEGW